MSSPQPQQTFQRRFPIFAGLAMFICFVVFPLFLVDTALTRILQIRYENDLDKIEKKLDVALDTLESCSNKRHFAHLLLNHTFTLALKSQSPATSLRSRLHALKQKYPGIFFFIVWNKDGQVIKEITDEKSFAYILRETYRLLQALADNCRRFYPVAIEKIPGIERRLKMLRYYIGRIVSTSWIQRPLQSGRLASAVMAEPDGQRSHLWYGVDKRISLLVFIHSDFFAEETGLKFAVKRTQTIHPELKAGFSHYPIDPETVYQHDCQINPGTVALVISRFENMYPGNLLLHKDRFFAYRYINPKLRAFCHVSADSIFSVNHTRRLIAGNVVKWLIVLAFLAWIIVKKYQLNFVPVKLKLVALFLYASCIPLLIIFIISADYLQQKRKELIYAEQSGALEKLRQIDEGFVKFLNKTAADISFQLRQQINNRLPLSVQKKQLAEMQQNFVRAFQPGSIMLFDTDGRNQLSEEGNMPFPDMAAISQIGKGVLEFLNEPVTGKTLVAKLAKPVAVDFGYREQYISSFSLANHETYAFFNGVGRREDYALTGIIFMFWLKEDLQKRYLELTMQANPTFAAYFPETDRYLAGSSKPGGQLRKLLYNVDSMLVARDADLNNYGESIVAAAMRGNNLQKACLAVFIPTSVIAAKMRSMYTGFALLSGLFLFFSVGGIILMRHRLLAPLQQFKEAIEGIGQRNFRCRLPLTGNNEFGMLSKALNHTLENLGELEVARIVQENLLPGREYRHNQLEVLASLTQMSHIGGDYYDFFTVNQSISGIFVGDVSGHGISSALIMAMARSAMIFENFNEPNQMHLMQTLNTVIYKMRQSGAKEYMSGLSLFINSNTGEFSLLNAGHCPPAIIRRSANKVEFQPCKGLYFGFKEEFTAHPLCGKLEKDDYLILYTDGWVESLSKKGMPFGFARFEQTLLSCCSRDLEVFSQQMFATISQWEATRDDDMTLLLLKFGDNHGS